MNTNILQNKSKIIDTIMGILAEVGLFEKLSERGNIPLNKVIMYYNQLCFEEDMEYLSAYLKDLNSMDKNKILNYILEIGEKNEKNYK